MALRPDPVTPAAGRTYPGLAQADRGTQQTVKLLWDTVGDLRGTVTTLQAQVAALQAQVSSLQSAQATTAADVRNPYVAGDT